MRVLRRIRSLVSTHAPQPTPADGTAVTARTDKKSIFTRALQGAVVLGAGLALTVGAAGLPQAVWATEDSVEAAAEETAAAQTYTAQAKSSDKTAKSADELPVVTVDAPEGALPEGAELHAKLVESEDDNQAVADELEKAEVSYDGFLALDVYFADADGNEVESSEPVDVRFELPEGAVPEDAVDLAVHHLAEAEDGTVSDVEAVADDADATEGTVAVQDDATVDAEFTVESFSTFTITWNNNRWQTIRIHCVDESGKEIGSNLNDVNRSSAITMSDIAPDNISGYTYDHAKVALRASDPGTKFTQLRYNGWNWQYHTANDWNWRNVSNNTVYLVYSKNPVELTTVDTVDSTAEGVHMYMFDYDAPAFNDSVGAYGDGQTKEGLLQRTTDGNTGWPRFSSDRDVVTDGSLRGRSLSSYFGGTSSADNLSGNLNNRGREVNYLFRLDRFNENGTFYYSSFDNFATLKNDGDSDFTVYEQLGSPSKEDEYFYQRGNFMPYNTLDTGNIINHNLYDSEGNRLSSDNERNNEDIYGFNEGNNFHFGMYVWADFYQPKDGLVESNDGSSSKEMVFEFTGDDDMWVYIDGVLVLDLGGIHDAQSGYINFATGEVGYTDTETNHSPDWHYTTIKAQYEAAGKVNNYNWDGNTYADGSSHRIQIFYMERGEGASNLKISFNLKTIPDGQLSVTKDVENYYAPQVADIEYTMQVTVNGETYANAAYTILGDEDNVLYTDSNGQFKLRHDQTALFSDLTVGNKVMVREVGSSDTGAGVTIEDNYDISYTVTDGAGNTTGDVGQDGTITAEMPGYGSIRVTVNNKATYTRPLKVVKNFDGTKDNKAPKGFEATYTLYEVDRDGNKIESAIGSVKYSDFENGKYVFWLDTDKNYTVVESFEDGDNKGDTESSKWSSVTATTNDAAEGTEASDGIVHLDENDATEGDGVDTITLTNHYGLTIKDVLKVTKTLNGHPLEEGMFDFTVEPKAWDNGDAGEEKVEVTADQAAEKAGLTPAADTYTYQNEDSAQSGEAGLVRMGNEITFTTDDIGKTYVYEYAELGHLNEDYLAGLEQGEITNDDVLFDSTQYRVELSVNEADSKLQVTMTKFSRESESDQWTPVESKDINSSNCDCTESQPLMSIDFENTAVMPQSITYAVSVAKVLEGADLESNMFEFSIEARKTGTGESEVTAAEAAARACLNKNPYVFDNGTAQTGEGIDGLRGMKFTAADAKAEKVFEYLFTEKGMSGNYKGSHESGDFVYDDTQYLLQFRPTLVDTGNGIDLVVELWQAESNADSGSFSEFKKVGSYVANGFHPDQSDGRGREAQSEYTLTFTNKLKPLGLQIVKIEKGTATRLPNAYFSLKDEDGNEVPAYCAPEATEDNKLGSDEQATNADGILYFYGLKDGEYTLTETRFPSGYQGDEAGAAVKFTIVVKDGAMWIKGMEEDLFKQARPNGNPDDNSSEDNDLIDHCLYMQVSNTKIPDLPQSGSSGTLIMSSVGVATIILAGVYLLNRRFPLSK